MSTCMCCSVMQYAACCSVLQCVAMYRCAHELGIPKTDINMCVLQCGAVCCSVVQRVAACCNVLQCVAVCCSVLQCAAMCHFANEHCIPNNDVNFFDALPNVFFEWCAHTDTDIDTDIDTDTHGHHLHRLHTYTQPSCL